MKRAMLMVTMLLVLGSAGVSPSHAQGGMRGKGGSGPMMNQRMYDTSTVESVKGEVLSIDTLQSGRARGGKRMTQPVKAGGLHMMLKTEKDTLSVHLGPSWYMEKQDVKIRKGDDVTVTGSRVTFRGSPVLIASQVEKDGKTVDLRAQDGTPRWSRRTK